MISLFTRRLVWATLLALLISLPIYPTSTSADEGWVINNFDAQITVEKDGSLAIVETLNVDFRGLSKHGIFRYIPTVYDYPAAEKQDRVYKLNVDSVKDLSGRDYKYDVDQNGAVKTIKIGDPDRTISGKHDYVIRYHVQGALNGFPDHDELFWNVMGNWPVATAQTSTTVTLPAGGIQQVACFQGASRSTDPCTSQGAGASATFKSTRALPEQQQMTIVVGFNKGIVPDPQPILQRKPRGIDEFFEATPFTIAGTLLLSLGTVFAIGRTWWNVGRDRRYTSIYYLSDNPAQETRPIGQGDPIVLEFDPPEKLKPAQVGLLLDEHADTLDATATIIDLAVRGYFKIIEIENKGFMGIGDSKDWRFERTDKVAEDLLPYEEELLEGLFQDGSSVTVSDLKTKFHSYLARAQDKLYTDAVQQKWFNSRPDSTRSTWAGIGIAVAALGGVLLFVLGQSLGWGLFGVPILVGGIFLLAMHKSMPHRTAQGSEMLRRSLGFRQYLATAEKDRMKFNEQANIFATYLPFAMVFGCVDKWAKALQDIDMQAATQGWYTGYMPFNAMLFSHNMMGFTNDMSSVITSTPPSTGGGSGSSGFGGGGFSGGGGGGGGGGSW